jgi:hypothetical protein
MGTTTTMTMVTTIETATAKGKISAALAESFEKRREAQLRAVLN